MIIAVSGNVGSGKTTLAKWISDNYGFYYIPQHRLEFDFIDDFFNDIEGKFFPAQVSFLLSKAIELQEQSSSHRNIIIDRSLLEDIEVFARLWIENRKIDSKIIQLYRHTADFIKSSVPAPDLYILCKCPADISLSRIDHRKRRRFEEKYPPNHIQMLEQYYNQLTFGDNTPYVVIDTTQIDFTNNKEIEMTCKTIFSYIKSTQEPEQISLFDDGFKEPLIVPGMEFHNFTYRHPLYYNRKKISEYIYLAAPFTQLADNNKVSSNKDPTEYSLLDEIDDEKEYGELPQSYQTALSKIQKALEKKYNMQVFLPHKDINNWGKTNYPSEYIASRIIDSVRNASVVVSIPGNSLGVHLELGIAIAHKIPVVIFDVDEFRCGYLIRGFADSDLVKYIKLSSINKIPDAIKKKNIL